MWMISNYLIYFTANIPLHIKRQDLLSTPCRFGPTLERKAGFRRAPRIVKNTTFRKNIIPIFNKVHTNKKIIFV